MTSLKFSPKSCLNLITAPYNPCATDAVVYTALVFNYFKGKGMITLKGLKQSKEKLKIGYNARKKQHHEISGTMMHTFSDFSRHFSELANPREEKKRRVISSSFR